MKTITTEVLQVVKNSNNISQKKYLAGRKQLRVWLEAEKFENFKSIASKRNTSMHRLINDFIDDYLFEYGIGK